VHQRRQQSLQLIAGLLIALVVGCGAAPGTTDPSVPSEVPTRYELPSITPPPGLDACAGEDTGVKLTLEGSPTSQPVAFARGGNRPTLIRWPPGYSAVFDPDLEIIDPSLTVVARAGDEITSPTLDWPGLYVCIGPDNIWVFRQADLAHPTPTLGSG
jgi:hypothetical protein